jgi:hypothetical protein
LFEREVRQLAPKSMPMLESLDSKRTQSDGAADGATGLLIMQAVAESTIRGELFDISES